MFSKEIQRIQRYYKFGLANKLSEGEILNPYCTQNNGKCEACLHISYNCYCPNNPLHNGRRTDGYKTSIIKGNKVENSKNRAD